MNNKKYLFCVALFLNVYAANIDLVWQCNRELAWEEDWLHELLTGFTVNSIDDGDYKLYINNSIIVLSSVHNFKGHHEYFEQLRDMHYAYGIIFLSDEECRAPTDFYQHAQFVFRNYWHKKFVGKDNVHVFPLGYKSGFWKHCSRQIKSASERSYVWSFAGQITKKPTREAMIQAMKRVDCYYIHETFAWADANSLAVNRYQDLLLNTIFVPCPTGWCNLDSFRVYEALECGCIPIVESRPFDYFGLYFGKHPFLVIESWDQAPALISALLCNPIQVEERRQSCHAWWLAYKEKLKKEWREVIYKSGIVSN